eukprot:m.221944 g.221944  ORF g.221944 m.221944 type:complete len:74 (-) comp25816_c1_seq3:47-268(-)
MKSVESGGSLPSAAVAARRSTLDQDQTVWGAMPRVRNSQMLTPHPRSRVPLLLPDPVHMAGHLLHSSVSSKVG